MKDETHILPGLISQSKQAISQKVAWFYLNCLPGAVGTAEKQQSSKEVLSSANAILNQQERSLIPPASGEREAALLERGSVVKKDYLNAQLYDSIKAYAEPLRMTQGPERIREELNRQIDRFLENTSREMREQVQFGLLRATSPSQLAKTLQEIFERRAKALNVYVCLYYERSAWQQLLESTQDYQVKYQFIVDDGACPACKQHQNVTYTYQQLMDKNLLPAIHPHCGCRLVPVGNVLDNHPQLKTNWYDPIRRIPDDFKERMDSYWQAQTESFNSGTVTGIVDVLTWGITRYLRQLYNEMIGDPSLYTIINWVTAGLLDAAKNALFPEEPLSLEHWLNSFYLASVITGVYQTAKAVQAQRAGVPKSGAGGALLDKKLMQELADSGVKYNADEVVMVTKNADGKLIWLEQGNSKSGLKHILDRHASNFADKGVTDIPRFLQETMNTIPVKSGKSSKGLFADYIMNENRYRVAYGTNGYIVSFYPMD